MAKDTDQHSKKPVTVRGSTGKGVRRQQGVPIYTGKESHLPSGLVPAPNVTAEYQLLSEKIRRLSNEVKEIKTKVPLQRLVLVLQTFLFR